MRKCLYMVLCGLWLTLSVHGQSVVKAKINSQTVWNFSESWEWKFQHSEGKKGTMALYREPKLDYWLIVPVDANLLFDEMTLWFILKPDGEVLQAYQEASANAPKQIIRHRMDIAQTRKLPDYWKNLAIPKYFGDSLTGFPLLKGVQHEVRYENSFDQAKVYLGQFNTNIAPLSWFNDLNIDAKLPIRFPKDIPVNYVPLQENSAYPGAWSSYEFIRMSDTEYYIYFKDYVVKN